MMELIQRLRDRLGDFWWFSLLLFCATRVGDVINVFIGLWLVPKYVPSEELGALLPLMQFAPLLALPISIFGTAFLRTVSVLSVEGRKGEIKSLLRSAFLTSVVLMFAGVLASRFFMDPVFERLRIEKGMLGVLVLATGFLGALVPIYTNALQALKRFTSLSVQALFGAPIRLIVMLVAIPFRAVSAYFLAGASVLLWQVACSVFSLRKDLGPSVNSVSFWTRDNTREFLRYSGMILLGSVPLLTLFAEALIIRQRLPSVDSAAYYMISRFAEVGTYAGTAILAVVFPFASEAAQKGKNPDRILVKSTLASFGFGVFCAGVFMLIGHYVFALIPGGEAYVSYVPQLAWLTLILSLQAALNCAISGEAAAARFGYLWWFLPVHIVYFTALYFISGYGYFASYLPAGFSDCMSRINDYGLNWVLLAMTIFQLAKAIGVGVTLIVRRRSFK